MNLKNTSRLITNAFTIDVEGFVESSLQHFYIPDKYINQSAENREIERNTNALIELLDEVNVKATFFFIGRIASDIPSLIKKAAQAGHEIGCHNYLHIRVSDMEENEFKEKLTIAKKDLEDVSGQKVYGFRAPDFSITKDSIWALDVLKELDFVYDSSIFPIGTHDVYGIEDADTMIKRLPNGLIEFPLPTIQLLSKRIPFGGGGYFRLYPLWLTRVFMAKLNKQDCPVMFYIHPCEVGHIMPKISELSALRKFRYYYNCVGGEKRLKKLLKAFKFSTAIEVLRNTDLLDFE